MLVLSRRENQKIVFPSLDISIDVLRVSGKVVRIGVDAPREVPVLREELAGAEGQNAAASNAPRQPAANRIASFESGKRHQLRNRLNKAMLGLQVLQMQLDQHADGPIEETVGKILENLEILNRELSSSPAEASDRDQKRRGADGPTEDHAVADPPSTYRIRESDPESPEWQRRTALIVDDSRNEAELMAQLLSHHGYDAQIVGNGREALDWLRQNEHPDIVLMDMNMPEMGGAEAIRAIRQDRVFDRLKVFGVSGLEQ